MARRRVAATCLVTAAWCGLLHPCAADPATGTPAPGHYLAGVPLDSLGATRDRPLFVPSRRATPAPAPRAVVAEPVPVRAEEPARLTLLGIIRTPERGGSAVVMDETDRTSYSLREGEGRRGWIVCSIDADAVTLQNQARVLRLTLAQARPPARLVPAD